MKRIAVALFAFLILAGAAPAPRRAHAYFAGGCFWCMEPPFERMKGVVSVTSGYAGGRVANPTYEEVSAGGTGHRESVDVLYDPSQVSYQQLLDVYWHNVDPLDNEGQFCDKGGQYRTAIFYTNAEERRLAEASKQAVAAKLGHVVYTDVIPLPANIFWPAEDYHQDYYKKNPIRYKFYRYNCGRDQRLEKVWGAAPEH